MYIIFLGIIFFLLLLYLLTKYSSRLLLIDKPDNRKIHKEPVPVVGGLAIFITIYFFSLFYDLTFFQNVILIGSILVLIFGLLDDVFQISAFYRFSGQTIATLFVIFNGLYIEDIGIYSFSSNYNLGLIGIFLTMFCVLCSTNAINFIDGIDGLSSGIVIIMFLNLLILIFASQTYNDIIMIYFFILLLFIFFLFNLSFFSIKKIFLGDAGSTTLGFVFGFLLIYYTIPDNRLFHPVLTIWIVALPMFDLLNIILKRFISGKNVTMPDNQHIHHIFLRLNFSNSQILILLLSISILLNLYGYGTFYYLGSDFSLLSFPLIFIIYTYSLNKIAKLKFTSNN